MALSGDTLLTALSGDALLTALRGPACTGNLVTPTGVRPERHLADRGDHRASRTPPSGSRATGERVVRHLASERFNGERSMTDAK